MRDEETIVNDCRKVAPRVRAFVSGSLDESDETGVRAHLAACGACRDAPAALDPTCLFLGLRREPLPPGFWTSFDARLRERLDRVEETRGWTSRLFGPALGQPRRLTFAAPVAMLLILGATLVVIGPDRIGWRPGDGRRIERGAPNPWQAPRPGRRPADPGATAARPKPAAPLMEGVASPGARVYRFDVGGAADDAPIYFVVDDSIDI